MPEQKVNKGIKDINYHNMAVVIAVGDKVINNLVEYDLKQRNGDCLLAYYKELYPE